MVKPTDYIHIEIRQKANNNDKASILVSEGWGSWVEYIEMDGEVLWTIDEEIP